MYYCPLFFLCLIVPLVLCDQEINSGPSTQILHSFHEDRNGSMTVSVKTEHAHSTSRKFLMHGSCTNKDISISQSRETTSGIPQYIVQIVNTCVAECAPYDIHLHCGWFASARIINPGLFKRLSYDDCLVNGGKPLSSSQIIRFAYSNSFSYPLAFKSAKFCSAPRGENDRQDSSSKRSATSSLSFTIFLVVFWVERGKMVAYIMCASRAQSS